MKYLYTWIFTGCLMPFLPLCAENAEGENDLSPPYSLQEEASLSSLEEELSLLDEEFEEFKEELFTLESDLQKKESVPAAQETPANFAQVAENVEKAEPLTVAAPLEDVKEQALSSEPAAVEFIPVTLEENPSPMIAENTSTKSPAVNSAPLVSSPSLKNEVVSVDLNKAFTGSPIIYTILLVMSIGAVGIWLYAILSLGRSSTVSVSAFKTIKNRLSSNHFEEALTLCSEQSDLLSKMVATGIQSRRHGLPMMVEAMKAEGKRASTAFWQKLSLLNDIAIIAPMIGLLGTVLGMFYAFYDINRSMESISTLFDGLGVSVGTTVAGLVVAILSLILHSTAKYRLVRALSKVENEAQNIATLIDDRTSIQKG